MSYDIAQPCVASFILFRNGNKIAFLLRANTDWMKDHYGIISGKVEKDESITQSAIREAKEEVGVELKPEDLRQLLVVYRHEPSSQAALWVDVYFEITRWKGELYNAEPEVHGELTWFDEDNLPKNIVPSHKFAIEEIQKGNTFSEYGWARGSQ